ncbi:hypothetical protein BD309DRAFT_670866 [Dichomitus squalens]|nr:hypothetical protein BD309DRAFT_670866 [Dichomitus squalens]
MQSSNSTAPTYTTIAILCGDAPDRTHANGATIKDVFETVISTTHNVSHMFGDVWPNPIYTCAFCPERAVERYTVRSTGHLQTRFWWLNTIIAHMPSTSF